MQTAATSDWNARTSKLRGSVCHACSTIPWHSAHLWNHKTATSWPRPKAIKRPPSDAWDNRLDWYAECWLVLQVLDRSFYSLVSSYCRAYPSPPNRSRCEQTITFSPGPAVPLVCSIAILFRAECAETCGFARDARLERKSRQFKVVYVKDFELEIVPAVRTRTRIGERVRPCVSEPAGAAPSAPGPPLSSATAGPSNKTSSSPR